jgi:hypothetical protein
LDAAVRAKFPPIKALPAEPSFVSREHTGWRQTMLVDRVTLAELARDAADYVEHRRELVHV